MATDRSIACLQGKRPGVEPGRFFMEALNNSIPEFSSARKAKSAIFALLKGLNDVSH